MSRKKHRGKGGSPHSDSSGTVRKQKAAKFAEKNLKPTSENSPMGNSESGGEFTDETQLENSADKKDSDKDQSRKRDGGNEIPTGDISEPQDNIRLKKAAAIRQAAEQSIADSRKSDIEEKPEKDGVSENPKEEAPPQDSDPPKADDTHTEDNPVDPQTAKRLKKAAYVKQMNEAKIAEGIFSEKSDKTEEKQEAGYPQNTKVNAPQDGKISNNNLPLTENRLHDPQTVRQLKKDLYLKQKNDKNTVLENSKTDIAMPKETYEKVFSESRLQSDNNKCNIPADAVMEAAGGTAEFVSAVQSGNAAKVIALPVKQIITKQFGESEMLGKAAIISSAAKNSGSIGGAAASIGTAAAADAVKRYVRRIIFSGNKNAENLIQAKGKKYRFLKVNSSGEHSEKRKKRAYQKTKFSEKNYAAKRNMQKQFYIGKNNDILTYIPKAGAGKPIKKKALAKLIAYALPIAAPLLILPVLLVTVASLFSWLTPFEYLLAGEESDTAPRNAETEEEIIDGYVLLVRNYLDVSQAVYYLEYGDWYGGVYGYPRGEDELSFSEFFSEKCEYILKPIREQFANALSNAPNDQARAAISSAMEQAIANALRQAQEGAAEEYQGIIRQLNDSMTAEEKRQHYEVVNAGGANGRDDTEEFDGKPIEGTNFFGNCEIQSDLSAEELMAMIALYKTLLTVQGGGNAESTEQDHSITAQDIMNFINDTEYIPINAELTHNNFCAGQNCRRQLAGSYAGGYFWEYYCLADHDNLSGSIEPCIGRDEFMEKIMELTDAEDNGFTSEQCGEMFDEYIGFIRRKLEIDESGYRQFGAADNERAKDFYEILIDPAQGELPNNFWEVKLPVVGETEENENE